MTGVFCGQRLFRRVMAEPGPAPNHTSLQPRSDSHRGWGGWGGGGQRLLSLGSDQTRAHGLPGDVTRPTSPFAAFPPSSPLLPIMCHMLHTLARRTCLCAEYVFVLGLSLSTQVKETFKSGSRGDKETHEDTESFAGSAEPEMTKSTSETWLGVKRASMSYSN